MIERLSKTHRNIALVLVFLVVGWFAWTVRSVLNPLILGYLFAYILRPLVQRLEDRGFRRRTAVNVIFALFGVSTVLLLGGLYVQAREVIASQVRLVESGSDPFLRAERAIDSLLVDTGEWIDETFGLGDELPVEGGGAAPPGGEDGAGADAEPDGEASAADESADVEEPAGAEESNGSEGAAADEPQPLTIRGLARAWISEMAASGEDGTDRARLALGYFQRLFGGMLSVLGFLVLLPVYTYFLLFELERIHEFVRRHVPKRERGRVTRIGQKVGAVLASFFRGRLLVCLLKGLVLALGLTVLQLPHGFLIGILAGGLALIPFVGPTIGYLLGLLFAFQQQLDPEASLWLHLGLVSAVFGLAEFLEGYVLIPKVLGDSLGLHPVAVLVSVFVGGAALGLFGFLIAIPLAATIIILFRELVMPAVEEFAEEDSHTRDDSAPAGGPEAGSGAGSGA